MILDILLLILTFVLDVSVSVGGFMIYKKKYSSFPNQQVTTFILHVQFFVRMQTRKQETF